VPSRQQALVWIARSNEREQPELRAAEAMLRASEARLSLARRERLPEPSVGLAYDRYWEVPELRTSVSASLNLPVSLGRRSAAEREARAAIEGARARREAALDEIRRRVTEASTQFEESLHELEVLRDDLLPAAERSLASAKGNYEAGRIEFSTLIQTSRDLAAARLEYHRTLASANQAGAELERALGGPVLPVNGGAQP
jgi:outer membrane protein TolC